MTGNLRLDFDNLPLVEVALRATYSSPIHLEYLTLIDIRDRLGEEFRVMTTPAGIEGAPGVAPPGIEIGKPSLLGADFGGGREGIWLSIQKQVVVSRWVRQLLDGAPQYPRFGAVLDAFKVGLRALAEALQRTSFPLSAVNISYANFIRTESAGGVLQKYFSPLVQVEATKGAKEIHKVEFAWREENDVDLRFRLESVAAAEGDKTVPGYRLITIAGSKLPADSDNASEALTRLHDRLQYFFRDLISEDARTEWRLQESSNG